MQRQLIFVYNADSGYFNLVTDIAHKIFSPATYPCSLCNLTYGVFSIRPAWEDFVKNAPVPLVFLHKDEFHQQFPLLTQTPLPAVFIQQQEQMEMLLDHLTLDQMTSIEQLQSALLNALAAV